MIFFQMGQVESELEYTNELSEHMSYYDVYVALPVERPALEAPTNVLLVVPIPLINMMFPCCPGCKVLNEPVTELVPIEEDYPVVLPCNNQGQAMRMGAVHTGKHAHMRGCSGCQRYGGVAHMQPSSVPRCKYPD